MKKAMISQPMNGKTEEEILSQRTKAMTYLYKRDYEIINNYFTDDQIKSMMLNTKIAPKDYNLFSKPLYYLAKSLELMAFCDTAYFCNGWENARGCRIEHEAARAYGLEIIYEKDIED